MGNIVIKKDDFLDSVKEKLRSGFKIRKSFNSKKYIGKLKLKEDPLSYQKKIRKEWNEYIG